MARNKNLITPEERQALAQDIQKRVDELTFGELEQMSNEEKNIALKEIETEIRAYLIRYTQMSQKVNQVTANYNFDDKENLYYLYYLYKSLLGVDMTGLLQDGYILIETLRKTFTGKEVEYEVGMEYSLGKGSYQLINKKISLAELLSYAKVDINWGASGMAAFKLRANSTKSDFMAEYNKQKALIESQIDGLHSLYPKVKNALSMSRNKGNIYETYQQLKYSGWADHSPKSKDPKGLKAEVIVEKYIAVKSGVQSFVTGGDFEMTQFKLLSAAPSIATLSTIGAALKMILTYIEQGKTAKISINDIKKNVFSTEFDNKMREGINELVKDVDDELSSYLEDI